MPLRFHVLDNAKHLSTQPCNYIKLNSFLKTRHSAHKHVFAFFWRMRWRECRLENRAARRCASWHYSSSNALTSNEKPTWVQDPVSDCSSKGTWFYLKSCLVFVRFKSRDLAKHWPEGWWAVWISASVFKMKYFFCWILWSRNILKIMKINTFRCDVTDISAEK